MIYEADIKDVTDFLQGEAIPFYVHSGVALVLHGIAGETDDFDLRVFHKDLSQLCEKLTKLKLGTVKLRRFMSYDGGAYESQCVEIVGRTAIDICSRMQFNNDLGSFEFPYEERLFRESVPKKFGDLVLPTARLETLMLYYLSLRRGESDGKQDERQIRAIMSHKDFDETAFRQKAEYLPIKESLLKLYEERKDK
ncbi:hypothetical protein COV18_02730 [Candidatus Woesearchaeota archaeon CG10_big_fil_rev_8_21_14_0_10_37_12]|nr:MAG: hypothetical protein COV18_02730 [Candidatus Woesearchaeota archaeon CG10_big_fil_rev_8_21_14_0_10_37_12]